MRHIFKKLAELELNNVLLNFNLMIVFLAVVWLLPAAVFFFDDPIEATNKIEHRVVLSQTVFKDTATISNPRLQVEANSCSRPDYIVVAVKDGKFPERVTVKIIASEMKPEYPVAAIDCVITKLSKGLNEELWKFTKSFEKSCEVFNQYMELNNFHSSLIQCPRYTKRPQYLKQNRLFTIFDTSSVLVPSINQIKAQVSDLERSVALASLLSIIILLGHAIARNSKDKE